MLRHSLLLSLLAPALLIGGCMGTQNRGLESVHQPVVTRQTYALDLRTMGDALARDEAARLDGWLATLKLKYGDKIGVDDPSGYRGTRRDVARIVAGYGLLVSDDRPVPGAPVAPGTVRVVVSRMYATVPGCPDWSRNASNEFENSTSSNFGCAINASLAAMVASPEDLVHGHAVDGTDPTRSVRAIEAFRKAAPPGGGGATTSGGGVK